MIKVCDKCGELYGCESPNGVEAIYCDTVEHGVCPYWAECSLRIVFPETAEKEEVNQEETCEFCS